MATLHKEYNGFNSEIKLNQNRKDSLNKSKNSIKNRIRDWFSKNRPDEIQPKFGIQGSMAMDTSVNPIPTYDVNGKKLLKYDLDYGVYFIAKNNDDVNKKQSISIWHNWVFDAVDDHTDEDSIDKNTCVRIVFADGHNIDLPIYFKKDELLQLAHKGKGWINSDPKAFYEWFNDNKTSQIVRIVRYFKAWKNFREENNNSLKLPSGFEFTILATNNFVGNDMDDKAFHETVRNIYSELSKEGGFKCLRPTTPVNEDVFSGYSDTRKKDFLNTLKSLIDDLDRAKDEKNFKKASEILINYQFGNRFPIGEDKSEVEKSKSIEKSLSSALITPKPYGY